MTAKSRPSSTREFDGVVLQLNDRHPLFLQLIFSSGLCPASCRFSALAIRGLRDVHLQLLVAMKHNVGKALSNIDMNRTVMNLRRGRASTRTATAKSASMNWNVRAGPHQCTSKPAHGRPFLIAHQKSLPLVRISACEAGASGADACRAAGVDAHWPGRPRSACPALLNAL